MHDATKSRTIAKQNENSYLEAFNWVDNHHNIIQSYPNCRISWFQNLMRQICGIASSVICNTSNDWWRTSTYSRHATNKIKYFKLNLTSKTETSGILQLIGYFRKQRTFRWFFWTRKPINYKIVVSVLFPKVITCANSLHDSFKYKFSEYVFNTSSTSWKGYVSTTLRTILFSKYMLSTQQDRYQQNKNW